MTLPFAILGALTIAGAVTALALRNLVHSVLALALAFIGLAGLYLQLGAQFVGFAQVLVYVGAVAILIVFAILLTRSEEPAAHLAISSNWVAGGIVAVSVLSVLVWTILSSIASRHPMPPRPDATVKQIGDALMLRYVLPLEVVGLLLTAALIGAVTLAIREKRGAK